MTLHHLWGPSLSHALIMFALTSSCCGAQLTSIRHKLHEEAWAYHGMDAAKLAGANITAKTEAKLAAKGFHSHIEYTFDRQLLAKSKVCQITVLQPLPAGVYADPYELANVVGMPSTKPQLQLAAYHVFGKIDVEKIEPDCEPTVLSVSANISIASLYLSAATLSAREPEAYHLKIPLHARYPVPHSQHPGHSDLYHNYTIEAPTVMLRCLDPLPQQTSGAATVCQDVCYVSSAKHDLRWTVPVGLDKHARLTQIATSAVAVGSLLALLVAVVSQPRSSISQTVLKQT